MVGIAPDLSPSAALPLTTARRPLSGADSCSARSIPTRSGASTASRFSCATKGDLAAAGPLFHRVLAASERVHGPEHPDTLGSLNNLALVLHDKGDLTVAEPLLRRVLDARERVLGPKHHDTLTSLYNLAVLLRAKGDLVGAETLARRAAQGFSKVLPKHESRQWAERLLAQIQAARDAAEAAEPED